MTHTWVVESDIHADEVELKGKHLRVVYEYKIYEARYLPDGGIGEKKQWERLMHIPMKCNAEFSNENKLKSLKDNFDAKYVTRQKDTILERKKLSKSFKNRTASTPAIALMTARMQQQSALSSFESGSKSLQNTSVGPGLLHERPLDAAATTDSKRMRNSYHEHADSVAEDDCRVANPLFMHSSVSSSAPQHTHLPFTFALAPQTQSHSHSADAHSTRCPPLTSPFISPVNAAASTSTTRTSIPLNVTTGLDLRSAGVLSSARPLEGTNETFSDSKICVEDNVRGEKRQCGASIIGDGRLIFQTDNVRNQSPRHSAGATFQTHDLETLCQPLHSLQHSHERLQSAVQQARSKEQPNSYSLNAEAQSDNRGQSSSAEDIHISDGQSMQKLHTQDSSVEKRASSPNSSRMLPTELPRPPNPNPNPEHKLFPNQSELLQRRPAQFFQIQQNLNLERQHEPSEPTPTLDKLTPEILRSLDRGRRRPENLVFIEKQSSSHIQQDNHSLELKEQNLTGQSWQRINQLGRRFDKQAQQQEHQPNLQGYGASQGRGHIPSAEPLEQSQRVLSQEDDRRLDVALQRATQVLRPLDRRSSDLVQDKPLQPLVSQYDHRLQSLNCLPRDQSHSYQCQMEDGREDDISLQNLRGKQLSGLNGVSDSGTNMQLNLGSPVLRSQDTVMQFSGLVKSVDACDNSFSSERWESRLQESACIGDMKNPKKNDIVVEQFMPMRNSIMTTTFNGNVPKPSNTPIVTHPLSLVSVTSTSVVSVQMPTSQISKAFVTALPSLPRSTVTVPLNAPVTTSNLSSAHADSATASNTSYSSTSGIKDSAVGLVVLPNVNNSFVSFNTTLPSFAHNAAGQSTFAFQDAPGTTQSSSRTVPLVASPPHISQCSSGNSRNVREN